MKQIHVGEIYICLVDLLHWDMGQKANVGPWVQLQNINSHVIKPFQRNMADKLCAALAFLRTQFFCEDPDKDMLSE